MASGELLPSLRISIFLALYIVFIHNHGIFFTCVYSKELSSPLIRASQLLVSTIIDPSSPTIIRDAFTLIRSIRLFGGNLNDATILVGIVGNRIDSFVDFDSIISRLMALQVEITFVPQVGSGIAKTVNKFTMFRHFDSTRFDYFLWLDADILVFRDPLPHLHMHKYPGEVECVLDVYSYMRRFPAVNSSREFWNPALSAAELTGTSEISSHAACNTGVLFFDSLSLSKFIAGLDSALSSSVLAKGSEPHSGAGRGSNILQRFGTDRFVDSLLFVHILNSKGIHVSLLPHSLNYMAFFEDELQQDVKDVDTVIFAHLLSDTEAFCSATDTTQTSPPASSSSAASSASSSASLMGCSCTYYNAHLIEGSIILRQMQEQLLPLRACLVMAGAVSPPLPYGPKLHQDQKQHQGHAENPQQRADGYTRHQAVAAGAAPVPRLSFAYRLLPSGEVVPEVTGYIPFYAVDSRLVFVPPSFESTDNTGSSRAYVQETQFWCSAVRAFAAIDSAGSPAIRSIAVAEPEELTSRSEEQQSNRTIYLDDRAGGEVDAGGGWFGAEPVAPKDDDAHRPVGGIRDGSGSINTGGVKCRLEAPSSRVHWTAEVPSLQDPLSIDVLVHCTLPSAIISGRGLALVLHHRVSYSHPDGATAHKVRRIVHRSTVNINSIKCHTSDCVPITTEAQMDGESIDAKSHAVLAGCVCVVKTGYALDVSLNDVLPEMLSYNSTAAAAAGAPVLPLRLEVISMVILNGSENHIRPSRRESGSTENVVQVMKTSVELAVSVLDMLPSGLLSYSDNLLLSLKPVALESQLSLPRHLNSFKLSGLGVAMCCDTVKGLETVRRLVHHWKGDALVIFVQSVPAVYLDQESDLAGAADPDVQLGRLPEKRQQVFIDRMVKLLQSECNSRVKAADGVDADADPATAHTIPRCYIIPAVSNSSAAKEVVSVISLHSWQLAASVPTSKLSFVYIDVVAQQPHDLYADTLLAWYATLSRGGVMIGSQLPTSTLLLHRRKGGGTESASRCCVCVWPIVSDNQTVSFKWGNDEYHAGADNTSTVGQQKYCPGSTNGQEQCQCQGGPGAVSIEQPYRWSIRDYSGYCELRKRLRVVQSAVAGLGRAVSQNALRSYAERDEEYCEDLIVPHLRASTTVEGRVGVRVGSEGSSTGQRPDSLLLSELYDGAGFVRSALARKTECTPAWYLHKLRR